jgi:hypothetical protein
VDLMQVEIVMWRYQLYEPEKWGFLKKFHQKMNHAFGVPDEAFWRFGLGERERMVEPVIEWCWETFGPPGILWSYSSSWVLFANDDAAFHFKMRWC